MCVCVQVLDWIENHGEAFLSKHTGVGKSVHRARALQKRHDDFQEVAQVGTESVYVVFVCVYLLDERIANEQWQWYNSSYYWVSC